MPDALLSHFLHLLKAMVPLGTAALLGILASAAQADVYTYVAEDGSAHFSDSPDDPRYQLLLQVARETAQGKPFVAATNRPFDREIAAVASSSRVEAALLHAVIAVESNYNPHAVSRKGALGLMQLMPATARAMGVTDPMDAVQNIRGGARYLHNLLERYANNKALALAAYNAGPGVVLLHREQLPPIAETRNYVPAVLRHYEQILLQTAGAPE